MSQQEIEQLSKLIKALDVKVSKRFDGVEKKIDAIGKDVELVKKDVELIKKDIVSIKKDIESIEKVIGFRGQTNNEDGVKKKLQKA